MNIQILVCYKNLSPAAVLSEFVSSEVKETCTCQPKGQFVSTEVKETCPCQPKGQLSRHMAVLTLALGN